MAQADDDEVRVEYEEIRGGVVVRCSHCGGTGSTRAMDCCYKASGTQYGDVRCCVCRGKGKVRV